MSFMFHDSNNIEIDLSLFNSKNVEDMTSMFAYSSGLKIDPNVMDSEILNLCQACLKALNLQIYFYLILIQNL